MIKYASNAFLATKISFINEIANVCEEVGADVTVVAEGMGHDKRIGKHFLNAGIGFGGSCFPKDVTALKQIAGNSGYHFQLLTAVIEVNELQKRRVVNKLQKHLGTLADKTIALLGLAFKPNTSDLREASSIVLASRLLGDGALVKAYDPVAIPYAAKAVRGILLCDDILSAVKDSDAVVLVTEWDEFADLPLEEMKKLMRRPLIIDGRNFLDPQKVRDAGFTYEGIGRHLIPARARRAHAGIRHSALPAHPIPGFTTPLRGYNPIYGLVPSRTNSSRRCLPRIMSAWLSWPARTNAPSANWSPWHTTRTICCAGAPSRPWEPRRPRSRRITRRRFATWCSASSGRRARNRAAWAGAHRSCWPRSPSPRPGTSLISRRSSSRCTAEDEEKVFLKGVLRAAGRMGEAGITDISGCDEIVADFAARIEDPEVRGLAVWAASRAGVNAGDIIRGLTTDDGEV